jgi:hypothetical protein
MTRARVDPQWLHLSAFAFRQLSMSWSYSRTPWIHIFINLLDEVCTAWIHFFSSFCLVLPFASPWITKFAFDTGKVDVQLGGAIGDRAELRQERDCG